MTSVAAVPELPWTSTPMGLTSLASPRRGSVQTREQQPDKVHGASGNGLSCCTGARRESACGRSRSLPGPVGSWCSFLEASRT
jgi:hypothetical protein